MRPKRLLVVAAILALVTIGGGAASAQAAVMDDPATAWDTPSSTVEYGVSWNLMATAPNADFIFGPWKASGAISGTPSGYEPSLSAYQSDPVTMVAFVYPQPTGRPLGPGTYTATLTFTEFDGAGTAYESPPATLTITPAALGIAFQVGADPSNPANAILSARFTGAFVDRFFSTAQSSGPLTPAGTWRMVVEDAEGEVAHEFAADRSDTDDVLAVSSYWSDVPPGEYTARVTFTPSGASADNFTVADAAPVAYTATAAPGSGSTAPPAPPAPPATEDVGMTLPLWIPIVAGMITAGLLALLIIQIVRLRRAGLPSAREAAA